jgi:hypothetical protein
MLTSVSKQLLDYNKLESFIQVTILNMEQIQKVPSAWLAAASIGALIFSNCCLQNTISPITSFWKRNYASIQASGENTMAKLVLAMPRPSGVRSKPERFRRPCSGKPSCCKVEADWDHPPQILQQRICQLSSSHASSNELYALKLAVPCCPATRLSSQYHFLHSFAAPSVQPS